MKALRWMPLAAAALGSVSTQASAAAPLDELAAARRVCEQGLDSAIARAERQRGSAAALSASVLPNPSLVVTHQQSASGSVDRETVLGLSVPLPISGRRGLQMDAAEARRAQAFADADVTLFEAALAFRETVVAARVEKARADVLVEQQAALETLSTLIDGLAKGGEAAGYDTLRQQTQARLHRRKVEAAMTQAESAKALLEAWTGEDVVLPKFSSSDLGGSQNAVFSGTTALTPRVKSLEAEARASQLEARAASRRWVPEPDLFAGYRVVTSGTATGHGFSLGLTLPLPFFDHGQGEEARAEAEQQVAGALAARLRRHELAQHKAAFRRLERLQETLAETEATLALAFTIQSKAKQLYASGEASITELLEAFKTAEEAQLAAVDRVEEIALARLALMRAAGTMFDAGLDQACGAKPGAAR